MRNFKELKIWQKGLTIATNTFSIAKSFPKEHKYGLGHQITKSGVSIPSNIAEGSSRASSKDYRRFVEISLGSCFELETQFLIALNAGIGNHTLIQETLGLLTEEEKMITSFMEVLRS